MGIKRGFSPFRKTFIPLSPSQGERGQGVRGYHLTILARIFILFEKRCEDEEK